MTNVEDERGGGCTRGGCTRGKGLGDQEVTYEVANDEEQDEYDQTNY